MRHRKAKAVSVDGQKFINLQLFARTHFDDENINHVHATM